MAILKSMTAVLLLATSFACRPSASDNYLFDSSTDQIKIDVIEQNKRITFKAPAGKKITKIKSISVAKERIGKFSAGVDKKYVSLFSDTEKPLYDIELTMDVDSSCRTPTNGVTLTNGGSFNVGCVSESALVTQLKTACKELSADPKIASFEEAKDSCNCLNRVNKSMKYSDYLGRVTSFKLECKNSGTSEQLKTFCTEIKDRQCPTCVVEALSCQCPKKVTLSYDSYLTNVEEFRNRCENPIAAVDTKPIDPSLTATQVAELFESECKKVRGLKSVSTDNCVCTNGLKVELESWKANQKVLESICTEDLEPEFVKPAEVKPAPL
jgi:hypothetical protein